MAGGLCCRLADAGLSGRRRGKEGGPPPGVVLLSVVARSPGAMVCRGWPSGWPAWRLLVVCRGWLGGGDPAAICGGNSEVFNQPLTIFPAVAMVWRLAVSFLCSYWQFRRLLGRFRLPGAGRGLADGLGGLRVGGMGLSAVRIGKGRGSGKRGGASQDGGRVLPHILPSPPWTLGGGGKQAGGLSAIRA